MKELLSRSMKITKKKVEAIRKEVLRVYSEKKPDDQIFYSRKKSSTSHSPPKRKENDKSQEHRTIKTDLDEIIEIDLKNKTCVAESGVTFVDLVKSTRKYGLIPKCVPELKTITIGGAIAGGSVESLSFKDGTFYDSCLELEVIDGTGKLHHSKKDEGIFGALHCTFGVFGIITCMKFELMEAKDYVRVNYVKYKNIDNYMKAIKSHVAKKDIEMMDGVVISQTELVLCVGEFVDKIPENEKVFDKFWLQPYYKRLRRSHDYFKLEDYLFRYDSDCHWSTVNLPFFGNKFFRYLVKDFLLGSSNLLKIGHSMTFLLPKTPDVIVDVFIPFENCKKFYEWYIKEFDGYCPLWVVPFFSAIKSMHFMNKNIANKDAMFVDFAIYGFPQKGKNKNYYKMLEEKVLELKGYKTLISMNYYTEEEFWKTFDKKRMQSLKALYDPKNIFRNLYSKTTSI